MPQAIIFMSEEENKVVLKFSEKWNTSKHETIKRIIKEYGDIKDGGRS